MLPVSIVDTPSIMMFGSPPPPMRCGVLLPSVVTPGARNASAVKLRFAIGRFWTNSVSTTKDRSPLRAWMSGDSPFTSTVSERPPRSSVNAPSSSRSPTLTPIPDRFSVLNPLIAT